MKLYTLEEASALLPQVIPVLESLRDAYIDLRGLRAMAAAHARGASGDGNLLANPWDEPAGEDAAGAAAEVFNAAARQLQEWGIEVKDPERGLIDFFHQRDGRTVYLCFHLGEARIGYWHDISAGFAGRQPV
jgi:hypothetical protein